MNIKKVLLGFALILNLSSLIFPQTVGAQVFNSQNVQKIEIESKPVDKRAQVIKSFLAKHNSPLENSAQDFIDAADAYDLDWRLVVSISGVESTFGKHIPGGHDPLYTSYNGWGWGVYGDNVLKFKSWREAIFTISKSLREDYVNKGYEEPLAMNRKYAASGTWGIRVVYFMNELEQFARGYQFDVELEEIELAKLENTLPETSGLKTQLANNFQQYSLDILH